MSWPRVFGPPGDPARRAEALRRNGPHIRVILRNPFEASRHIEAGALIDTGASCICISKRIAKELGLTRTGETRLIAVGADHPAVEYAAQLSAPELDFDRFMLVLAPAGVYATPTVLLGRSFLHHFVFTYHGHEGVFQFHNEARDAGPHHEFDE